MYTVKETKRLCSEIKMNYCGGVAQNFLFTISQFHNHSISFEDSFSIETSRLIFYLHSIFSGLKDVDVRHES